MITDFLRTLYIRSVYSKKFISLPYISEYTLYYILYVATKKKAAIYDTKQTNNKVLIIL